MTGNSNRNHKGSRREAGFEGSGMGDSGLRYTNRIRGTWLGKRRGGTNRPNRIGHPELSRCICVQVCGVESHASYPGRSASLPM